MFEDFFYPQGVDDDVEFMPLFQVDEGEDDATSDDDLDAFIRTHAESAYHPCGTCRMGTDDLSVVDPTGRIHGTENLLVVDASIFPHITNGNLNAPVIMAAEKIADGC